jgi:hypothetical protein
VHAQGEFEEARALMGRLDGENKLMRHVLARGRSLVGELQGAMPREGAPAPALQAAVANLGAFIAEARGLLEQQAALYKRFEDLPNWRKGLTG